MKEEELKKKKKNQIGLHFRSFVCLFSLMIHLFLSLSSSS